VHHAQLHTLLRDKVGRQSRTTKSVLELIFSVLQDFDQMKKLVSFGCRSGEL